MLGYYYISQKFLSAGIGLGYARIATTPRQKMEKYKDIVKFFSNKRTKSPKSVYVRGRDIFSRKVREKRTKQVKNVPLYSRR